MGLKLAGARLLLKGGLLNRTLYVGIRGASGEFTDSWYSRQSIALAGWTRTNGGDAENTAVINYTTPTANAAQAPTEWGLYSASTSGTLYATQALSGTPSAPAQGASFGFDAGALELSRGTGAVTGRGMRKAYESGLVSGTTYVAIFSNQPSGASPNQIDNRISVAAAGWVENSSAQHTVRNSAIIDYGVQSADEPRPTWVGIFDAAMDGNLLWEKQISPQPSDPVAGASISIPANGLSVGFTVDS